MINCPFIIVTKLLMLNLNKLLISTVAKNATIALEGKT